MPPIRDNRNATIDGIRGYLALGVLCHHFYISRVYWATGNWVAPDSTVFRNFGAVAVGMFFMITAYLFYGKIVTSENTNWLRLYRGRILRIVPLYLVSVTAIFLIVAAESGWVLHEPAVLVATQAFKWLTFTIIGAPDINGVSGTAYIIASVAWTLRYEWVFYCCLPLLALVLAGVRPKPEVRIAIILAFSVLVALLPERELAGFGSGLVLPFLLGMLSFEVKRNGAADQFCRSMLGSIIASLCILLSLFLPLAEFDPVQICIIGVAFIIVASGGDLFGILRWKTSLKLGDASYSIYLLHGLMLYGIFWLLKALQIDPLNWSVWFILPIAVAAVSLVSMFSFRWIERPFIELGHAPSAVGRLTTREAAP